MAALDGDGTAARRHRPRVELVPARGVHVGRRTRWWRRTDEIHEAVRIGEGLDATGELQPEPMERALETLELYAHFCRATGIDEIRPVATSAIRDATNREEFLDARARAHGLEVRVLSREEEARYGYLAAVNSTTLADGVALDLGGGSMQLTRVEGRLAADHALVAAGRRAHDRALPARRARQGQAAQGAARARRVESSPQRAVAASAAGASSGSAARSATSPPPPSWPPGCRLTASRASRDARGARRAGRAARRAARRRARVACRASRRRAPT